MNKKELRSQARSLRIDIQNMKEERDKAKTNHILHLILSIVTAGIWLLVWIVSNHFDVKKRIRLEKKIKTSEAQMLNIEDQLDNLDV